MLFRSFDLLNQSAGRELRGEVPASAWFEHSLSDGYYIQEHSLRTNSGDVLSLLWWKNERMLIKVEEYEEQQAARRSDWREEE